MTDPRNPHSADDELLAIPAFLRRDTTSRAKTRSPAPRPRRTKRIGSIYRAGRRYRPVTSKTPPPAKRP